MTKTIGDYWRECTNEQLAVNMVDFLISMFKGMGIDERDLDLPTEYEIMLDFFNEEFEELPEAKSNNGYSYIH